MWSRWQHSVLLTDVACKLYGFDEHSTGNERLTDPDRTLSYRVMSLMTPAFTVRNAVIVLLPQKNKHCFVVQRGSKDPITGYDGCPVAHPLQLGISVLSKLRIYFATKERMLYLSLADHADTERPVSLTRGNLSRPHTCFQVTSGIGCHALNFTSQNNSNEQGNYDA